MTTTVTPPRCGSRATRTAERSWCASNGCPASVTAPGWQTAAGDYGKSGTFMSVADVRDPESLGKVRSHKKQMKAKAKEAKAAKG